MKRGLNKVMKYHHVGIAVKEIESALEEIKQQYPVKDISGVVWDPRQKAYLCMMTLEDGFQMELIAGEAVKSYLKRGQNLYHICYEVEDIEKEIKERSMCAGCMLISEPKEAVLFGNKRVAFIRTNLGLVELVEK